MPVKILMPALSPTMEEGALAKWLVKEGDTVIAGDVIAEIETDKAMMEMEAVEEGVIGKIVVPAGTTGVKVNELLAVLLEEGESESDLESIDLSTGGQSADEMKKIKPTPAPAPEPVLAAVAETVTQAVAAAEVPFAPPAEVPSAPPPAGQPPTNSLASPLARRLAKEAGLDLGLVSGSGPHGRIIKRDIEAVGLAASSASGLSGAVTPPAEMPPHSASPPPGPPGAGSELVKALYEPGCYDEIALDEMHSIIARRLTAAKRDIPHFYLQVDCEIDALLEARKRINEDRDKNKISVNDFVIKACAMALKKVPEANASWAETTILRHHHADISVAVAIEGGLITPIIRAAESKDLAAISSEMKTLAGRAQEKRLAPQEYQGGGFTISNLGMFGIKEFSAVINPPQGAILAVGAGEQRTIVRDGAVAIATMMSLTLSCDHRVIDGVLGARLLAVIKNHLQDPVMMLA